MNAVPWLTILTLVPVVGALFVLSFSGANKNVARRIALTFSFIALAVTLFLWAHFDSASGALQFQQQVPWITALGVEYHVGIDGLGLLMLLLT
ncbi:MAG: NADH-quinone oxidoreductase subunit M, partial [Acidobacteriaceae bacterium]